MSEFLQNYETEFLMTNREMLLGTAEDQATGRCSLRYISPDGRSLYFLSRTATRHCQIITNFSSVMVVISEQPGASCVKKGVEVFGKAEKVCEAAELKQVAARYCAAFPGAEKLVASFLPHMTGPGAPFAFYRLVVESVKALPDGAGGFQPQYIAA